MADQQQQQQGEPPSQWPTANQTAYGDAGEEEAPAATPTTAPPTTDPTATPTTDPTATTPPPADPSAPA